MREGADRDVVYTTNGRVDQNCVVIDTAAHLKGCATIDLSHRPPDLLGRHVVEQQPRRTRVERLVDLPRVAHLDREREVRTVLPRPADRLAHAAGERRVV